MEGEGQLLIIAAAFNKYLKKNNDYTTKQQTSCGSIRRDVLYNILIEFGVAMTLVGVM